LKPASYLRCFFFTIVFSRFNLEFKRVLWAEKLDNLQVAVPQRQESERKKKVAINKKGVFERAKFFKTPMKYPIPQIQKRNYLIIR